MTHLANDTPITKFPARLHLNGAWSFMYRKSLLEDDLPVAEGGQRRAAGNMRAYKPKAVRSSITLPSSHRAKLGMKEVPDIRKIGSGIRDLEPSKEPHSAKNRLRRLPPPS